MNGQINPFRNIRSLHEISSPLLYIKVDCRFQNIWSPWTNSYWNILSSLTILVGDSRFQKFVVTLDQKNIVPHQYYFLDLKLQRVLHDKHAVLLFALSHNLNSPATQSLTKTLPLSTISAAAFLQTIPSYPSKSQEDKLRCSKIQ